MFDESVGLNRRREIQRRCEGLDKDRQFAGAIDRIVSLLEKLGFLEEDENRLDSRPDDLDGVNIAHFGRRMQIPTGSAMEIETIEAMNRACVAEAELINLVHKRMAKEALRMPKSRSNVHGRTPAFTTMDVVQLLKLSRENTYQHTEDVFDRTGLIGDSNPARKSSKLWPVWMQATLEDLADICDRPNALEVFMLAQYFQREMSGVYDWFILRRSENKDFDDLRQRIASMAGSGAHSYRLRQELDAMNAAQKHLAVEK